MYFKSVMPPKVLCITFEGLYNLSKRLFYKYSVLYDGLQWISSSTMSVQEDIVLFRLV